MRLSTLVASVLFFAVVTNAREVDNMHLKCLVCSATMKEIQNELAKVDPKRNIDIGNYRLDAKGNEIKKTVPMARSAVHISDVLDDICAKLEDYVRATYKSNGKLTVMSLMTPTGEMNPEISSVDIVQDGDLNKSLEHLCREVVADEEDAIIEFFQKGNFENTSEVCTSVCEEQSTSEDDATDENATERTEL